MKKTNILLTALTALLLPALAFAQQDFEGLSSTYNLASDVKLALNSVNKNTFTLNTAKCSDTSSKYTVTAVIVNIEGSAYYMLPYASICKDKGLKEGKDVNKFLQITSVALPGQAAIPLTLLTEKEGDLPYYRVSQDERFLFIKYATKKDIAGRPLLSSYNIYKSTKDKNSYLCANSACKKNVTGDSPTKMGTWEIVGKIGDSKEQAPLAHIQNGKAYIIGFTQYYFYADGADRILSTVAGDYKNIAQTGKK
ncbi:hypothetical protein Dip510_000729 [Elusimicrobium posterum]|uniref:hypothetical protein n=1 Tax=Elusimicrobium posterum TaxID=3116653 RepID=UPI003C73C6D8